MGNIVYDESLVNESLGILNNVDGNINNLGSELTSIARTITSATGFSAYVGTFTDGQIGQFSDMASTTVKSICSAIKSKQIQILTYSQDANALMTLLSTLTLDDYQYFDDDTKNLIYQLNGSEKQDAWENFGERTCATAAVFGLSFAEGVGQFGEALWDLGDMAFTGVKSIFTGAADLWDGLWGKKSSRTKDMWKETSARVAKDHVTTAFDKFYETTASGQYLKNNSFGFDTVRSIGNGLGYSTGVMALSVVTGGGAGAILKGGGLKAAKGTLSLGKMAVNAGLLGFSKNSASAWANGASVGKGLAYGAAAGSFEGLQWYVGGKIGQDGGLGNKFADKIFAHGGNASRFAVSSSRVLLDAVDSGVEGFVQPGLDLIYKDSYTDVNGNEVFFSKEDSFAKRYAEAFDDAGGMKNVMTQTATGAIGSVVGEATDAVKLLKSAEDGKTNANTDTGNAKNKGDAKTKSGKNGPSVEADIPASAEQVLKTGADAPTKANVDAQGKPSVDTPTRSNVDAQGKPSVDTPTRSNVDAQGKPSVDTPTKANVDAQGKPSVDTPTRSNVDAQGKPSVDTPTRSNVDAQGKPSVDTPTRSNVDAQATPKVDTPTRSNIDAQATPKVDTPTRSNIDAQATPKVDTPTRSNIDAQTTPKVDTPTRTSVDVDDIAANVRTTTTEPNITQIEIINPEVVVQKLKNDTSINAAASMADAKANIPHLGAGDTSSAISLGSGSSKIELDLNVVKAASEGLSTVTAGLVGLKSGTPDIDMNISATQTTKPTMDIHTDGSIRTSQPDVSLTTNSPEISAGTRSNSSINGDGTYRLNGRDIDDNIRVTKTDTPSSDIKTDSSQKSTISSETTPVRSTVESNAEVRNTANSPDSSTLETQGQQKKTIIDKAKSFADSILPGQEGRSLNRMESIAEELGTKSTNLKNAQADLEAYRKNPNADPKVTSELEGKVRNAQAEYDTQLDKLRQEQHTYTKATDGKAEIGTEGNDKLIQSEGGSSRFTDETANVVGEVDGKTIKAESQEVAPTTYEKAKQQIENTVENARQSASELKQNIADGAAELKQKAANGVEAAKQKMENTVENVRQSASELKQNVADGAAELKQKAANGVEAARQTADSILPGQEGRSLNRMESIAEELGTKSTNLKNAQADLEAYRKNPNADPKVTAELEGKVRNAQAEYDTQLDKLRQEQKTYAKATEGKAEIGTEGNNKLIQNDDGSTTFTNESARKAGEIDGKTIKAESHERIPTLKDKAKAAAVDFKNKASAKVASMIPGQEGRILKRMETISEDLSLKSTNLKNAKADLDAYRSRPNADPKVTAELEGRVKTAQTEYDTQLNKLRKEQANYANATSRKNKVGTEGNNKLIQNGDGSTRFTNETARVIGEIDGEAIRANGTSVDNTKPHGVITNKGKVIVGGVATAGIAAAVLGNGGSTMANMTPYVGTLPVEEIPNSSSLRNYETPTQPTNNTPVQNTEPTPSNNGNNDSSSSTPSSNSGDSGGHHTSGSSSSGDTTSSNSNDLVNSEIDTPLTPPTVNTGTGNSGGGYYGDSGFKGESTTITDTTDEDIVNSIIDSTGTSIKIPTSSKSLDSITTSKKKNSVPIAASLGAAAIAGIGAKTFMDTKENDDEEDEENEEEFVKESESNNNEGFALGYSEDEDSAERDYIVPTDEWAFIDGQE